MKVLKIILIIIVVIVGGAAIYMATLDGKYDVNRSVYIDATPEMVYAEVSDFKTWPEWSSWFEKDETMKAEFGDPSQGVGATYSWTSENQGSGDMVILEAEPGKSMKTQINFGGMGSSNGYWMFEPKDGGTQVTWGFKGEMPFFFRFMAANMDEGVGPDFEKGLSNLKENIESRKPQYEFTEMTLQPTAIYYTHHENTPMSTMSGEWFGANWGMISGYLAEDMNNVTGAPMAIYWDWNEAEGTFSADLAIPCSSEKPGNDVVMKGESYSGKVIKTTYMGAYDGTGEAHMALEEYMKANNIPFGGPAMEVYVTDPSTEPDTAKWVTEIYYGVAEDDGGAGQP